MLFHRSRAEQLAELADQVRASERVTTGLMSTVATTACERITLSDRTARSVRIQKLIDAGAWTDAVLALIEGELPQWKLRRLAYDEGQWYCALSRQRELPEWLDQAVEASHQDYSLAMLQGFVEALRQREASEIRGTMRTPRIPLRQPDMICCDNFA